MSTVGLRHKFISTSEKKETLMDGRCLVTPKLHKIRNEMNYIQDLYRASTHKDKHFMDKSKKKSHWCWLYFSSVGSLSTSPSTTCGILIWLQLAQSVGPCLGERILWYKLLPSRLRLLSSAYSVNQCPIKDCSHTGFPSAHFLAEPSTLPLNTFNRVLMPLCIEMFTYGKTLKSLIQSHVEHWLIVLFFCSVIASSQCLLSDLYTKQRLHTHFGLQ